MPPNNNVTFGDRKIWNSTSSILKGSPNKTTVHHNDNGTQHRISGARPSDFNNSFVSCEEIHSYVTSVRRCRGVSKMSREYSTFFLWSKYFSFVVEYSVLVSHFTFVKLRPGVLFVIPNALKFVCDIGGF